MTTLRHSIAAVTRRLGLNRARRLAGFSCAIAAALTALIIVAVRAAGTELSPAWPWWVILIPSAAAVLLGAGLGWFRRPTPMQAAILLDRQLRLKDRIGTAQAIQEGVVREQTFATVASRDAERLLQRMSVAAAVPMRIGGEWSLVLPAAALLAAVWLWMPVLDAPQGPADSAPLSPAEQQALQQTGGRIAANLQQVSDQLRDELLDPRAAEQLAALDRLAEQIAAPAGSPTQVRNLRDESAARLNELAEEISRRSRRDLEAADQLARRFDGLQPRPDAPLTEQQLLDALRRGEFSQAAAALAGLFESAETPAERRRLAETLREMSEQVQAADPAAVVDARRERENFRTILREQGVDEETIEQIMAEADGRSPESAPPAVEGDERRQARQSDGTNEPAPQTDEAASPAGQSADSAPPSADAPPSEPAPPSSPPASAQPDAGQSPDASPPKPSPPDAAPTPETAPSSTRSDSAQPKDDQSPDASRQPPGPPTAPPTAEETRRRLEDRGVDPDVADRLARQLEQTRRQNQASDQARRDAEQLSRELDQAAKQLDSQRDQPPQENQPSPPSPRDDRSSPSQDQASSSDQRRQDQGQSPSTQQPVPAQSGQQQSSSPSQPSAAERGAAEPVAKESRGQAEPEASTQGPQRQDGQPRPAPGSTPVPDQTPASSSASKPQPTSPSPKQTSQTADAERDSKPSPTPEAEAETAVQSRPSSAQQDQSVGAPPSQTPKGSSAQPMDQPARAEGTQRGANEQPGGQQEQMTEQGPAGVERERAAREGQAAPTPSQADEPSRNVDKPSEGPGGTLMDKLRELDQRRRNAQERQAASEDLRRRAREIADNLTDEERRRLAAWAQQYQREQGAPPTEPDLNPARQADMPNPNDAFTGAASEPGNAPGSVDRSAAPPVLRPGSTDIVDARGPMNLNDPGDQIIAEWLSPGDAPQSPDATAATQQRLESARRAAERAVNEQSVNRRYHELIQRYFKGLDKTITPDAKPQAPPSPAP